MRVLHVFTFDVLNDIGVNVPSSKIIKEWLNQVSFVCGLVYQFGQKVAHFEDENNGHEDTEMICGHSIRDMIRNEYVRNNVKSE